MYTKQIEEIDLNLDGKKLSRQAQAFLNSPNDYTFVFNKLINKRDQELAWHKFEEWEKEEQEQEKVYELIFQRKLIYKRLIALKKSLRKLKNRLWLTQALIKLTSLDLDTFLTLNRISPSPDIEREIRKALWLLQNAQLEIEHLRFFIARQEKEIQRLTNIFLKLAKLPGLIEDN